MPVSGLSPGIGVAVVGYPGAGKSTAGEQLADIIGAEMIETGDIVREGACEYFDVEDADELSSEQLGEYSTMRRREDGGDYVATDVIEHLERSDWFPDHPVVIVGMRDTQVPDLFENYFDQFTTLWIHAPFDVRLERLQDRGRNGESEFTEDDLKMRDGRENMWGTAECILQAEYSVMNDLTEQELRDNLVRFAWEVDWL